ncbi:MAG: hypothetical protein V1746_03735 [bacterium]
MSIRQVRTWGPLSLVSLFWALLYLPHLRVCPTWYGDETSAFLIGRALVHGQSAVHALTHTFVFQSYPSQPLYSALVGFFTVLFQGDIVGARFFNTLLALGCSLAIYLLGKRILGAACALAAALLFLGYEQSLIHFRSVFPHNGVAFGFTLMTLYLCRPATRINDLKAGAGLLLATASYPLAMHGAAVSFLSRLRRPASWFWIGLLPFLWLCGVFLAYFILFPQWVISDLQDAVFNKYAADTRSYMIGLPLNFIRFVSQDWFHIGAYAGAVCALWRRRSFPIGIGALVITILLIANRANLTIFYYQAVILLPLLALCWGVLLSIAFSFLRRCIRSRFRLLWAVCLATILLVPIGHLSPIWRGGLRPRNQPWTTQNIANVEAAAAWINERVQPDDFVIANTNIAWLLHCKTGDWLQTTAWLGYPTFMFERGVPHERFLYSLNPQEAKFAVIGDIDVIWSLHQPNVVQVYEMIKNWPEVWISPTYRIYVNPRFISVQR